MSDGAALYVRTGLITLLGIAIFAYALFEARLIIEGPVVTITTPKNGATVHQSLIDIAGTTRNITQITLDDRPISIDTAGRFSEELLLAYGYNILKVYAADRFGRTTTHTIELVYQN